MHSLTRALVLISLLILLPAYGQGNNSSASSMTSATNYPIQNGKIIEANCEDGSSLIDKMLRASFNLNDYSADYEMLVYKGKDNSNEGKQIIKETGTFYFSKPRLFRVEVKSGPKSGSIAILAGDGKVHGHLGGMLKYFWSSVSPNSSLVRAINDYPMVDADFYSLVQYLKNMLKQGDSSLKTRHAVATAKTKDSTYILDMYSTNQKPPATKPLLLKRIYVNPKTYLPVFWQDYINGNLWSESSWYNLRDNLKLPANTFKT